MAWREINEKEKLIVVDLHSFLRRIVLWLFLKNGSKKPAKRKENTIPFG